MAEFINTIDILGDDDVRDSIIDKSIREYKDDTVSTIGVSAFFGCANLATIETPAATFIGNQAFYGCSKLTDAVFPLVTKIDASAFPGCTSLITADFPSTTEIGDSAFDGCSKLETAVLPVATRVGRRAFADCRALTDISLPEVIAIFGNAFSGCSKLETVDFPKATNLYNYVFMNCTSLRSVNLPAVQTLDTLSFGNCKLLATINLPMLKSVAGNLFDSCESLTTADFAKATGIASKAFIKCLSLSALILRNTTVVQLSNKNAFNETQIESGTGYIYVPAALVDGYKTATNWSAFAAQFRAIEDWTVDGTVTGELDIENRRMVRFFNDDGTLLGYSVVTKGSNATYNGTPVCSEDASWAFKGFAPEPVNVTEDMDCYAQYEEPFSLETASWARISEISAEGTAANYMSVGDTKSVALNGTMGTISLDDTYSVYVLGINHNSEFEGAGITFGGFKTVVDAKDVCLIDSRYNDTVSDGTKYFNVNHWGAYNYGGWGGSDIRYDILGSTDVAPYGYGAQKTANCVGYDATSTCATSPVENTLMSCLPADLRAVMKPITKWTNNTGNKGDTEEKVTAMVDYLPLLAEFEVFGSRNNANSYEQKHQQQYAYFASGNNKVKYRDPVTRTEASWRTRSPYYDNNIAFCITSTSGGVGVNGANYDGGIAPVFMI